MLQFDDNLPMSSEPSPLVLLMDRRENDAKLIISTLEKAGFHVSASSNQADAVRLCRSLEVPLAIIHTGLTGAPTAELLEHIREVNPAIRVLLMTDNNHQESKPGGPSGVNVDGCLVRPFRRAQLLGSVLDILHRPLVRTA